MARVVYSTRSDVGSPSALPSRAAATTAAGVQPDAGGTGGLVPQSASAVRGCEKLAELLRGSYSQPSLESVPSIANTAVAHWQGRPSISQVALKALALDMP